MSEMKQTPALGARCLSIKLNSLPAPLAMNDSASRTCSRLSRTTQTNQDVGVNGPHASCGRIFEWLLSHPKRCPRGSFRKQTAMDFLRCIPPCPTSAGTEMSASRKWRHPNTRGRSDGPPPTLSVRPYLGPVVDCRWTNYLIHISLF